MDCRRDPCRLSTLRQTRLLSISKTLPRHVCLLIADSLHAPCPVYSESINFAFTKVFSHIYTAVIQKSHPYIWAVEGIAMTLMFDGLVVFVIQLLEGLVARARMMREVM